MSSTAATSRPLLFVNSDPADHGTVPHRRAVYQHVQLKYAKWKRSEEARKKRASVTYLSPTGHGRKPSQTTSQHTSSQSNESTEDISDDNLGIRYHTKTNQTRRSSSYKPLPVTVLQAGNSDPFNSLAIKLDPKANALMRYTRDFYLPGIQRDVNDPGVKVVGPEWAQCVSFLQDEGLAFSHLARMAAIIASDPNQSEAAADYRTQALVFKSKGLRSLRQRLQDDPNDAKTYNQILLLMNAETFDHNFDAATAHAGILVNLLQSGTIHCDHAFLFKVLYHDNQRAAMSLTRPLFDLDEWVPNKYRPVQDLMFSRLPPFVLMDVAAKGLDPILDDSPALKQTLTIFRHACICLMLTFTNKTFGNDIQLLFHGRFNMTMAMGRLINHYLDAMVVLDGHKDTDRSQDAVEDIAISRARIEAILSLSSVLLLRCLTRIDSVKISGDIALFNANALITEHLKDVLDSAQRHPSDKTCGRTANAKLYALFIGAWLEQAKEAAMISISGSSSSEFSAEGGWFNIELATQARAMHLSKWEDVRTVLLRFVYTDTLQPNGAYWFPYIMNATESPDTASLEGVHSDK